MKPTLALFLELGGSFEEWNDVGFFSREIALYNRLTKDFFGTIYIFTYGSGKDLAYAEHLEKNIVVIPRGKRSRSYLNNFLYETWMPFKHRSILKKCDIFKTNQNSGSIAASIAKILFPRKILVIRSGYIGSELARRSKLSAIVKTYYFIAEQLSYRICNHALISAEDNKKLLMDHYPFLKKKITVLNNFIDTDIFRSEPTKKIYDIIYVARFDRDKNHRAILNATKGMDINILFIGKGKEYDEIEKLATQGSIKITIIGSIPNDQLPKYYNSSKICAFPSLHEGSPKTLLEAMACELPVVALDSPGVTNIIRNQENGLIGPASSLQTNISLLLNDPTLRDTLGKAARTTVLNEYAFQTIVKKEIVTYRKLLNL